MLLFATIIEDNFLEWLTQPWNQNLLRHNKEALWTKRGQRTDALVKIFLWSEYEGAEMKMPLESHLFNQHTNGAKLFAFEDVNFKVENKALDYEDTKKIRRK